LIAAISFVADIPHSAPISRSQYQNSGSSRSDVGWPLITILLDFTHVSFGITKLSTEQLLDTQ
jgi:hypothetical protein